MYIYISLQTIEQIRFKTSFKKATKFRETIFGVSCFAKLANITPKK
jgi:hypothetical protein